MIAPDSTSYPTLAVIQEFGVTDAIGQGLIYAHSEAVTRAHRGKERPAALIARTSRTYGDLADHFGERRAHELDDRVFENTLRAYEYAKTQAEKARRPALEGQPDIAAIAHAAMMEMRRTGESYDLCARVIAVRVRAALANTKQPLPTPPQVYRDAEDGRLYVMGELGEMEHPETGVRIPTVNYRAKDGGKLLTTTWDRWTERFLLAGQALEQ